MIVLKAPEEIEIMRAANVIVAEVLAELRAAVRPGVTTADLDRIAEELTRKRGAVPAFKGYSDAVADPTVNVNPLTTTVTTTLGAGKTPPPVPVTVIG